MSGLHIKYTEIFTNRKLTLNGNYFYVGVIQGYGHDLQRPNVFSGLCTKAELVWFNVVLYSCLCVIMQLELSSVTTFVHSPENTFGLCRSCP